MTNLLHPLTSKFSALQIPVFLRRSRPGNQQRPWAATVGNTPNGTALTVFT